MGIGDNFDTSVPGLKNQRTGRASGHALSGQDDNGGHPCNAGCGCKPVCSDAPWGGCMLPPELKISILQLPSRCTDQSGNWTTDETAEDCEGNNGTCSDSSYTNKQDCETNNGTWTTSGDWEATSRTKARAGARETFWLRYENGAWRGRKCCGENKNGVWDMDSG